MSSFDVKFSEQRQSFGAAFGENKPSFGAGFGEVNIIHGKDGKDGITPDLQIGEVETLYAGSPATATITGTKEKPVLNLGIPRGASGDEDPFEVGHGLQMKDNTLSVNSVSDFEGDNTLPATASLVQTTVGNIEVLLATI